MTFAHRLRSPECGSTPEPTADGHLQVCQVRADDLGVETLDTGQMIMADDASTGEAIGGVILRFAGARYAVDMGNVAEVVPVPATTRVPGGPSWLTGVVNWRGRVLPIVDLRPLVGAPLSPMPTSARLVVLAEGDVEVGLIADMVPGPARLRPGVAGTIARHGRARESPRWYVVSWTSMVRSRCSTLMRCWPCARRSPSVDANRWREVLRWKR